MLKRQSMLDKLVRKAKLGVAEIISYVTGSDSGVVL